MSIIATLLAIFGLGTSAGWYVISKLYYICQPSEILIFAGTKTKGQDGIEKGYRLVKGGSSIRTPLLEQAFRMDLTNMIIELQVASAYSKGGIPLTVEGVANIKIAGEEPTIHNAIERLLGKSRNQIEMLAKQTLEGNLRGVLASLTPEQVNEDKIAFAKSLLDEAEEDLEKLGLVLDNLQIQNISDEVHYLNSIGRQQQAELLRDARIAEATAKAESNIKDSANKKSTSLRQIGRDLEIAKAEAEKRIRDAVTKRSALVAEAEAEVVAKIAKAEAELAVQNERIKQVKQQLQADIVAPAEAQCKQAIAKAKGDAASIIEDGKAQAEGTQRLAESWKAAGADAKDIFLFQKLETLMKMMAAGVPNVKVESLTVIDGKDGSKATQIASFVEQLRQTTGVDVAQVANNLTSNTTVKSVKKLQPSEIESQPH
jgi:flotillin